MHAKLRSENLKGKGHLGEYLWNLVFLHMSGQLSEL
jgi:hypothetical protein